MQRTATILTAIALSAGLALNAFAQSAESELNTVMSRYLALWNRHDATTITRELYRLEPTHPWSTEAGLKAEFDRLKSQGYSHSDIQRVSACATGADTGQVELKFIRLKTDGDFMPPKDRTSIYRLKKFPDGWRITGMASAPAGGMVC